MRYAIAAWYLQRCFCEAHLVFWGLVQTNDIKGYEIVKKKVHEFTSGTNQQIWALKANSTSYILNVVMDEKECATGIRRDLRRPFKHVVARFCTGIRECFCTAYILHNLKALINYLHRIMALNNLMFPCWSNNGWGKES